MESRIRPLLTIAEPGPRFVAKRFVLIYLEIVDCLDVSRKLQGSFQSCIDEIYITAEANGDGKTVVAVSLNKKPHRSSLRFAEVDGYQPPEIGKLSTNANSVWQEILRVLSEDPNLYRGPNDYDWQQQQVTTLIPIWYHLASSLDSPCRRIIWVEDTYHTINIISLLNYANYFDMHRAAIFQLQGTGKSLVERIRQAGEDNGGWNMTAAIIIVTNSALSNESELYDTVQHLVQYCTVQTTIIIAPLIPDSHQMPQSDWEAHQLDNQGNIVATLTPGNVTPWSRRVMITFY